jgi:hypothetical protein
MGAFSAAHDETDVERLLSATRSIVDSGILSDQSPIANQSRSD